MDHIAWCLLQQEHTLEYTIKSGEEVLFTTSKEVEVTISVDLKERMSDLTNTFMSTYYNKYKQGNLVVDADYSTQYANSDITSITINKTKYDGNYHAMSIGMDARMYLRAYKVKNKALYVALPYLITETLPGKDNTIVTDTGAKYILDLYAETVPSLSIVSILTTNPKNSETTTGKNSVTYEYDSANKKYIVTQTTTNNNDAIGLIFGVSDENGNITELNAKDAVVFRLASNGDIGSTGPDTFNSGYSYNSEGTATALTEATNANYMLYTGDCKGANYSEESSKTLEYKLAMPGYGAINVDIVVNKKVPEANQGD